MPSTAPASAISAVFDPFTLPNGSVLPNRLVKAAMEENMATLGQLPGKGLFRLYERWSAGGVGLIITGNVMVHAEALTGPAGVVLDADAPREPFREWARAAKSGGAKVWMQINHPGRQIRADMPGVAWAPSAIQVNLGRNSKRFAEPTEMTVDQIEATIERFATTAHRAEEAGFDGVEIHAAHGYLLSQFLSPLSNQRTDAWGGSLENRARILLDVVRAVRETVTPSFAVAVKINAEDLARASSLPLMLTGGIARRPVAEEVLAGGIALVGMGSALAVDPDLPNTWRQDVTAAVTLTPVQIEDKAVASAASMARVRRQLRRLGRGRSTKPGINPRIALLQEILHQRGALRRYRTWLDSRASWVRRQQPSSRTGSAPSTTASEMLSRRSWQAGN